MSIFKNYKKVVTIFLVAFFLISIFYMFDERIRQREIYSGYLAEARDLAKTGVPTEAEKAYQQAVHIYANYELYQEIGSFYLDNGMYRQAQRLYRDVLTELYPKDQETYCYGEKAYLEADNIKGAFRVYNDGLDDCKEYDRAAEILQPNWYHFKLSNKFDDVRPFSGEAQLAAVRNEDGTWYYIDGSGLAVSSYSYQEAGGYNRFAAVTTDKGKAVCIDENGDVKITSESIARKDPEFGEVKQFMRPSDGMLAAYNGKVWNFYEDQELTKVTGGFDKVLPFSLGVGAVSKNGNDWALIDASGKELTGYEFKAVLADVKDCICRNNTLMVKRKDGCWLVDQTGKNINQKPFEDAQAFADSSLAAVKVGGKWKFVTETGEIKDLGDFDQVHSFANGLAAVCKNSKWGYIDEAGNVVIDCQFEAAMDFSAQGLAFVKEDLEHWRMLVLTRLNCG